MPCVASLHFFIAMVKLQNISKSFEGKKVIHDLSLEVNEGEFFTFLGESGCGKTTLLRLLAGFEQPDRGEISIVGKNILPLPVEKRPVGFIFQNYALFPHLSVYDNIAVGPRVRGLPEDEIEHQIETLLEITRIQELKHALPKRLSGGESQRVAIARAIINRPKVLLLDEPFAALDQGLRQKLRYEVAEMQKTFGITFLFVTHDQEEALSLSHRIGILKNGRLLQVGKPDELYDHPETAYVAGFLGEVNKLSGMTVQETDAGVSIEIGGDQTFVCDTRVILLRPKNLSRAHVMAYVRPENIHLSPNTPSDETLNQLQGIITKSVFFGGHIQYEVKLDSINSIKVRVQHGATGSLRLREGSRVCASFHPQNIWLFDENQE